MPVDNLDGGNVGVSYFGDMGLTNPVIVSPDAGGVYRAKQFRDGLAKKYDIEAGLAMIVKQKSKDNEIKGMDLVGSVKDCDVILGESDCGYSYSVFYSTSLSVYSGGHG